MPTNGKPSVLAVIPARFASTRFPGKVIAPVAGKPLVAHTYDRTVQAGHVTETVVATDDRRVAEALEPYGIPVAMTRPGHPSGTDRIAEVAERNTADIVVNVQGDEPLIDPHTIDAAIEPLLADEALQMATARRRITDASVFRDPNVVKVVCDLNGRALYFSRSAIPFIRDAGDREIHEHDVYWQHIGLYVYRKAFLLKFAQLKPTPLEKLEKLEQLRVLENGYAIAVVETEYESIGVDSPQDLERVSAIIARKQAGKM